MTDHPTLVPSDTWLDRLGEEALTDWITARLAGHDPHFPFRPDEQSGGELIARRCAAAAPADRHTRRIAGAVERIVARLVEQDMPDIGLFREALALLSNLEVCRLPAVVRRAARSPRFQSEFWRAHDLDQHLLLAIVARANSVPEGFWEPFLEDPRFMELALVGLQKLWGWEWAAEHLVACLRLFEVAPDDTNLPLALLNIKREAPSPKALVECLKAAMGPRHAHAGLLETGLEAIGLGALSMETEVKKVDLQDLRERLDRASRVLCVLLPPTTAQASLARDRTPDSLRSLRAA